MNVQLCFPDIVVRVPREDFNFHWVAVLKYKHVYRSSSSNFPNQNISERWVLRPCVDKEVRWHRVALWDVQSSWLRHS